MSSLAVLGPDVTVGGDGAVIGITNLEKAIMPSILEETNTRAGQTLKKKHGSIMEFHE